ncbi:MAG: DUF6356 family protein [Sphingomicrobium sp.]
METQQREIGPVGVVHRMFFEHPRSLGMTWLGHGVGAVKIGAVLVSAGLACIVHAVVPAWFTQTAGRKVAGLHAHMVDRKANSADPGNWPDYEI